MRIAITGAAGMLGRKLVASLAAGGQLSGRPIERLDLVDVVPITNMGSTPQPFNVVSTVGDLGDAAMVESLVAAKHDVVFHLAGVVSGEAETDLDKGLEVNLDGSRTLFDGLRRVGNHPRVVFTSSIAVFGQPLPDVVPDNQALTPLTSYGTQKAMSELLLADYSRRGLLDGISIRLPTITVRPGKPNAAASGFFSSIIREPLVGLQAVLPVSTDLVHTHASPRCAVNYLIRAAELDTEALGTHRSLSMPGVAVSVGEQIEALEAIAGPEVVKLIRPTPDRLVESIVATWPQRFTAKRALSLGFKPDASYEAIIKAHIEDELS